MELKKLIPATAFDETKLFDREQNYPSKALPPWRGPPMFQPTRTPPTRTFSFNAFPQGKRLTLPRRCFTPRGDT